MDMLDEEHERLPQSRGDTNIYSLGSINGHNIVIAGLPRAGNCFAATVITQMRMTFPSLRYGLLVGIGGGVPMKTNNGPIRLGHVVVSDPTGIHSGAVQYDHGKAKAGQFELKGSLAPPPTALLNAARDMAVRHHRMNHDPIWENTKRTQTSHRALRRFKFPGTANDHLYPPYYEHRQNGVSCEEGGCDPDLRIERPIDEEDDFFVVVHRGTIASGELVIKDAKKRDDLAQEHGVLCFEMEAAGALTDFPYLEHRSQPYYIVPSLVNRHFTGRESTLDELRHILFVQAKSQKAALFGLGGVGKTQVALQLTYWVKKHIPECSIFWAPALSLESYEQACSRIVKKLEIRQSSNDESSIESVRQYMSSDVAGRWFFIVDNADDSNLFFDELEEYLPASENGTILITTRSSEVAVSFAERDAIELLEMTPEEATTFFAKVAREDLLYNKDSTAQLLEELHFLPLAITQAAFYMSRVGISTSRYLEMMHNTEKDRANLMSREFHDSTRYPKIRNAVATSWFISFNHIKNSNPSAAALLGFLSYIEPKAIPRSVFPPLESEEEMEFAIGTLCGYAFLTRREEDGIFDMHSLVQLSTRLWLEGEGQARRTIESAIQSMEGSFPSCKYTNREIWRAHLPHALQILQRDEARDTTERWALLSRVARCILADGRTKEAVGYFDEVNKWHERYPEDHPSRLAYQHELACAYQSNGQIKQAVELLEHVVAVRKRTLDEENPDRLASQHELARAYQSNGQIKQAVQLLEHVVVVRKRTLDEENSDRLASQHVLAMAYRSNGQIKQAVELLEYVVVIRKRIPDEEHPDRLASQHELARVYQSNGQTKQAMELLEHVVVVRQRTLDEEHPDRLASQHELAWAYQSNGQIRHAVELLEHVVAVRKRTLDEEHPDRLASQHILEIAYRSNGQIKEAVELLEHVVAVRKKTLEKEHPSQLASQYELARLYQSNGQIQQAIELLRHVVAIEENTLDKQHPDRLMSQHELARAYQSNGQIRHAVELLEHVVAVRKKTLGEEHPDRLASQHMLTDAKQLYECLVQTTENR
ncbi:Tetratricopeptide-like helical [Penicillium italicum]|uniref:Tetratricopeptide-like helical n=1 Tax=Penicillium italicum TaxID=40296 RepID=A0A0A2L4A5_PENIT|nr:Tetratricopeptide-like helical [Penicillium italicum]